MINYQRDIINYNTSILKKSNSYIKDNFLKYTRETKDNNEMRLKTNDNLQSEGDYIGDISYNAPKKDSRGENKLQKELIKVQSFTVKDISLKNPLVFKPSKEIFKENKDTNKIAHKTELRNEYYKEVNKHPKDSPLSSNTFNSTSEKGRRLITMTTQSKIKNRGIIFSNQMINYDKNN